ncbi:MAG TPA: hypothetical protein VEJ89_01905, partial [Myxococcaceae bacterium]|nr:hypothetical protein [Myxococcaceae bacterium]
RWQSAGELERALADVVRATTRSLEDTDVGAYLRRLFPEESGAAEVREAFDSGSAPRMASPQAVTQEPAPPPDRSVSVDLDLSAPEPAAGGTATRSLSDAERTGTRRRRRALAVLALLALVAAGGVAAAALRGIKAPAVEPVTGGVGEAAPARIPPPEGASAAVPARPPEPPPPPAATTERAAPPAPALGRLTVRVRPWADVWIDGARRAAIQGSESFSLPSGPHRVVVRGPAGATSSFRVTVRPGRTTVLPPSGGPLDVSAAPAAAR